MRIGKQSASSAHRKWEERRLQMAEKRGNRAVLHRGTGAAGEAPGLKEDNYGETEVIGSFNPDAVWGATKIQESFRASKRNAAASTVFEVEGQHSDSVQESWHNPTYPAYSLEDSSGADCAPLPPPSESDWGVPSPPSQSDWEEPPSRSQLQPPPSLAGVVPPPPPPRPADIHGNALLPAPPLPPPRPL